MSGGGDEKTYTPREIFQFLNNAVIAANNPSYGKLPKERMGKLLKYSLALISPIQAELEEGYLRVEEAVAVLSSAALTLQAVAAGVRQTEVGREIVINIFGKACPICEEGKKKDGEE